MFGSTKAEHDTQLLAMLKCIQAAGVTLNVQKCEFGKTSVKFLGNVIDKTGIRADPRDAGLDYSHGAPLLPEHGESVGEVHHSTCRPHPATARTP